MARHNGRGRKVGGVGSVAARAPSKRATPGSAPSAVGASSYALLTRVALVALPAGLYWDCTGFVTVCANAVAMCLAAVKPFVTAAADLIAANPPEAILAALITVWALSSASILGRHHFKGFRHRAQGVHDLAQRLFRKKARSASAGPPPSPGRRPRPGFSLKLAPGPRIVLEWVTTREKDAEKQASVPSSPAPSACTVPDAVSPPRSPESASLSSSVYWPDLSFLPWQGASQTDAKTESVSGMSPHGIYTEFQRNLDHDMRRRDPNAHLSHSCSMPLLSAAHASGPVSFDCDIGSTDLDEIMEGSAPDGQQDALALAADVAAPEGVMQALPSLSTTGADAQLAEAIPPAFFLQFASLLGDEPQAGSALRSGGLPEGCTDAAALFGAEEPDCVGKLWERLVHEERPGALSYTAERRPLRRGIFMYRTVTVYENASAPEVRRFTLDDASRGRWDDNALEHGPLLALGDTGSLQQESCFLYTRSKFPRPMAAREYLYGRRVAGRPDGGAYIVQTVPPPGMHPPSPQHGGRGVRVTDFTSCARIRAVLSPSGRSAGAVEIAMIYFEDSQVRPGLMNMAVAKGLWPFVQRQEAAFRCYQSTLRRRSASLELSAAARQAVAATVAAKAPGASAAAASAADAISASFLHAPATWQSVPGDGWVHEDMPEVEYQSVSPRPGSRRARWKRRLLVAVVVARHVIEMLSDS